MSDLSVLAIVEVNLLVVCFVQVLCFAASGMAILNGDVNVHRFLEKNKCRNHTNTIKTYVNYAYFFGVSAFSINL